MMQQDIDSQKHIETYRSLISISVEIYKTLLLLNGGAIIALLTYIGSKQNPVRIDVAFSLSIYAFIAGVFCVPIAFVFSYLVQMGIYKRFLSPDQRGNRDKLIDKRFNRAIVFTILSIVLFGLGSIDAAYNLLSINKPTLSHKSYSQVNRVMRN